MRVFISWSGQKAQKIAVFLKDWLKVVAYDVEVFFSDEDIESGIPWFGKILNELNSCQFAIICLTDENLQKPWLFFEAGAIANHMEKANVCPFLFDISVADLKGPLSNYQVTRFDKDDIKKLLKTLYGRSRSDVDANVVERIFENFWPELEKNLLLVRNSGGKKTDASQRTQRDIVDLLEEILSLSRYTAKKPSVADRIIDPSIIEFLIERIKYTHDSIVQQIPRSKILEDLQDIGSAVHSLLPYTQESPALALLIEDLDGLTYSMADEASDDN